MSAFTFITEPYQRHLSDGLILKSLASDADAERLIAFNDRIFGADVAAMTRSLIFHHPTSRPEYWLYVENESQIVSSLVLIPWEWCYDNIILKSAEMGIVGTDATFRNRGLVRLLDARFKELLYTEGFHLSHIQGIPYFYRQFGYEYTLPLEAQWRIELRNIPDQSDIGIRFRLATHEDVSTLMEMYTATVNRLSIAAIRTSETWHYLLEHTKGTATETETWMIEINQQPVAYCRIPLHGFGEGLIVSEVSPVDQFMADAVLHWLRDLCLERGKPYIRFNLPEDNSLLTMARSYGAYDTGGYQWQVYIPDVARLLVQLVPVVEQRLSASPFANLSRTIVINLYRAGVEIRFEQGQIKEVKKAPVPTSSQINIPPNLVAPLVLGYRNREQLSAIYPDFGVYGQSQALIDVLFPGMHAWIDSLY